MLIREHNIKLISPDRAIEFLYSLAQEAVFR